MAWEKGKSGNPKGRPKDPERAKLRELARTHTESAIATLVEAMNDTSAKWVSRLKAAEILLDRGWGKATPIVEEKGDETEKVTVLIDVAPPSEDP